MKRSIIIGMTLIILLILGHFMFRINTIIVYIGIEKVEVDTMDISINIDGMLVFNDTIVYDPYKYEIFETNLNSGFHSINVNSHLGNAEAKKNIFVLLDRHVVIEYYSTGCKGAEPCFDIRNRFTKFLME
jgi:hypothetical protein